MSAEDYRREPRSPRKLAGWALFGLALFALFIGLGTWQVHREAWKLDLIARVNARIHAEPAPAPGPDAWDAVNAQRSEYRHVRVTGHYVRGAQVYVHASTHEGVGYWVMTPLKTQRGFFVLINRGYVDRNHEHEPAVPVPAPKGQVTVTGLLRISNPGGLFLRPNDPKYDRWYSRDVAAIAADVGLPAARTAPYFIDADTGSTPDKPPIGGLTVVDFRNAHVIYAITWYCLAALVVIAAVLVTRFELRIRRDRAAGKSD